MKKCSFCEKSEKSPDVTKLVENEDGSYAICDKCILACNDILKDLKIELKNKVVKTKKKCK